MILVGVHNKNDKIRKKYTIYLTLSNSNPLPIDRSLARSINSPTERPITQLSSRRHQHHHDHQHQHHHYNSNN